MLQWEEKVNQNSGQSYIEAVDEAGTVYRVSAYYDEGFVADIRGADGRHRKHSSERKTIARKGIRRTSYVSVGAPYKTMKAAQNWCQKEADQSARSRETHRRNEELMRERRAAPTQ